MNSSNTLINKVEASGLIVLKPDEKIAFNEFVLLDLKDFLFDGLILKEKKFREDLQFLPKDNFQNKIILVFCSVDAIIPMWAYMLIASELSSIAKDVIFGNEADYRNTIFKRFVESIKPSDFIDKKVVLKGCGKIPIPEWVYMEITLKLRPVVKSLMFGEPCSTVPIFKQK